MILNYDVIQRSEIHVAKHVGHRNDQLLLVIRPTGLEKKNLRCIQRKNRYCCHELLSINVYTLVGVRNTW